MIDDQSLRCEKQLLEKRKEKAEELGIVAPKFMNTLTLRKKRTTRFKFLLPWIGLPVQALSYKFKKRRGSHK